MNKINKDDLKDRYFVSTKGKHSIYIEREREREEGESGVAKRVVDR